MADNQFASTIGALFQGMDEFVTTKTVVGETGDSWRCDYTSTRGCNLRHGGGRVWSVGEREECGRHERQDDAEARCWSFRMA